jgi:hypothetical protein
MNHPTSERQQHPARAEAILRGRLHRLLAIQSRVEQGAGLDAFEIAFLTDLDADATAAPAAASSQSVLERMNGEITRLCRAITGRALDNLATRTGDTDVDYPDATAHAQHRGP